MRTNRVIVVALLALAIFGAGVIVGERLGSRRAAANPSPTKSASGGVHGTRLLGMNARPGADNSGTAATSGESASVAEIEAALQKADALRKDPSIRVRVYESDHQVGFTVALRRWGKSASDCPHASLRLVDPEGAGVGRFGVLGGDIRLVLHEDVLRAWGWEDFKPAEAFRFTVSSNLLAHSTFEWEYGPPYPNDEHGFPRTGTLIFRSHLKDLVEAAQNANEEGPWKGSQPNR